MDKEDHCDESRVFAEMSQTRGPTNSCELQCHIPSVLLCENGLAKHKCFVDEMPCGNKKCVFLLLGYFVHLYNV